jgi:hypothetical protein
MRPHTGSQHSRLARSGLAHRRLISCAQWGEGGRAKQGQFRAMCPLLPATPFQWTGCAWNGAAPGCTRICCAHPVGAPTPTHLCAFVEHRKHILLLRVALSALLASCCRGAAEALRHRQAQVQGRAGPGGCRLAVRRQTGQ